MTCKREDILTGDAKGVGLAFDARPGIVEDTPVVRELRAIIRASITTNEHDNEHGTEGTPRPEAYPCEELEQASLSLAKTRKMREKEGCEGD